MQPLNDYVVIEKIEEETPVENSAIILPEDAKDIPQPIGKVVAMGPGKPTGKCIEPQIDENNDDIDGTERIAMFVSIGDTVLFYEQASQKFSIDDKEYYVMLETNIFLILEKNKDEC